MVIGDYTVDQVIEKAQTLIEAMPYIKKFQGKTAPCLTRISNTML